MAEVDAVMAIGDEALCMKQAQAMPFELDLGAAWQELTGLPFVFGVWAVRRDFAETQPEATGALHRLLLRSKTWGLAALPELSRLAAASFNMTPEQVLAYFHQLDYSLGPEHERGLSTFFHYLHEQGELAEEPRLEYFQGRLLKVIDMEIMVQKKGCIFFIVVLFWLADTIFSGPGAK